MEHFALLHILINCTFHNYLIIFFYCFFSIKQVDTHAQWAHLTAAFVANYKHNFTYFSHFFQRETLEYCCCCCCWGCTAATSVAPAPSIRLRVVVATELRHDKTAANKCRLLQARRRSRSQRRRCDVNVFACVFPVYSSILLCGSPRVEFAVYSIRSAYEWT